jgi:hypothetical protein
MTIVAASRVGLSAAVNAKTSASVINAILAGGGMQRVIPIA